MFSTEERARLRDTLVAAAKADPNIVGAALVGSSARGFQDKWSDIDLALSVAATADLAAVVHEWTERIYREHGAVSHLDVLSQGTLYRVFLLPGTLQLDVSFWAESEFGATGPHFRLLFGETRRPERIHSVDAAYLIGMGWLYALHARSSIARNRLWQAEYMISGMRDQVLALICLRHGMVAVQARGIDDLPPEDMEPIDATLVRSLNVAELERAFSALCAALVREIQGRDPDLAARLAEPIRELALCR